MDKYDKMPDHITILDKMLSLKGQLRSFLLQHAIYSVDQYRGADKSLARPERKQATETEDFYFHISYL